MLYIVVKNFAFLMTMALPIFLPHTLLYAKEPTDYSKFGIIISVQIWSTVSVLVTVIVVSVLCIHFSNKKRI
jgi:hypothetical protein